MSEVVHKNAADSYGAVAKQQAATGTKSDTLLTPFRNYNNYVKKALVQQAMSVLIEPSTPLPLITEQTDIDQSLHQRLLRGFQQKHDSNKEEVDGFSVLDIASGRGGDLNKWLYGQHPPVSSSVVNSRSRAKDRATRAPLFRKKDIEAATTISPTSLSTSWECCAPKEHPVYVANVTSVDISPGAVEIGLERFRNIITVDVAPGTKTHDSMVKNFREGRELPPAQFFVSNCLSPVFWPSVTPTCTHLTSVSSQATSSNGVVDTRLKQSIPDVCDTIFDVRSCILTKLRPSTTLSNHETTSSASSATPVFPFDIISVQFAFHYACETFASIQANLAGMYSTLVAGKPASSVGGVVPRGVLVLTTVDAVAITKRLRGAYKEQCESLRSSESQGAVVTKEKAVTEVTYTSKLFSLTLPICTPEIEKVLSCDNELTLPLGTRYHFKLEGHVDCDEFVVPYADLVRAATTDCSSGSADTCATANSFALLDSHSFIDSKQYLHEFNTTPKYKRQMDGKSLEADDLDLIGIYRTYVFGAY
jgi:hypothetical protein